MGGISAELLWRGVMLERSKIVNKKKKTVAKLQPRAGQNSPQKLPLQLSPSKSANANNASSLKDRKEERKALLHPFFSHLS